MKTQISRFSDQPDKRYSGVYMQQGRMIVDSDGNELNEIIQRRVRDALRDIIGSGTPADLGVLRYDSVGKAWGLYWGRLYADGQPADLQPDSTIDPETSPGFDYDHQADFPSPPATPAEAHILYVDTWERAVTSLEDAELLDVAFAGADTATRSQTMAQVKWAPEGSDVSDEGVNPRIGTAEVTVEVRAGSGAADPCDPCADELSLDSEVGNYLFRVELHEVKTNSSGKLEVTLKWSSENGAEQYLHQDKPQGFEASDWAYEKLDDDRLCEKLLGVHLATGFEPTRGALSADYPGSGDSDWVRRWDGYCRLVESGSEWALLEVGGDGGGTDRGVGLSESVGDEAPGRVKSSGGVVSINLRSLAISIDLNEKRLVAGDYWLAAVRGAVHQQGETVTGPKTPDGIYHRYLPLAAVSGAGELTPADLGACKPFEFPPLTDLTARDICYSAGTCKLTRGTTNVQDALQALCAASDMADHNRHLHGCGVVCGYKVHCAGVEVEEVTVTSGYAVMPDGSVLKSAGPVNVNVKDLAAQFLDGQDSGVVVLVLESIDEDGVPQFVAIADYERPSPFTIWRDFLEHCIGPIVERLKEMLSQYKLLFAGEEPGGDGRLAISLFNLFCQEDPFNIPGTDWVYLSRAEHDILEDFYEALRGLLRSNTDCAAHNEQPFPAYPFDKVPMGTVFGWGVHTRVRTFRTSSDMVNSFVFTCGGASDAIHVYDTKTGEMKPSLRPPALAGLTISDVAVDIDASRLYAVAQRGDDTLLAWAKINGDRFEWVEVLNICDFDIRTIVPDSRSAGILYGAAIGKGMVLLRPEALLGAADPEPPLLGSPFYATGHLVEDRRSRRLVATGTQEPDDYFESGRYTGVQWYDLDGQDGQHGGAFIGISWEMSKDYRAGSDGLAEGVVPVQSGHGMNREPGFYLAVDPREQGDSRKAIFALYATAEGYTCVNKDTPIRVRDTTLGMSYHYKAERLMVSMEEHHGIMGVRVGEQPLESWACPVQVGPIGVAVTRWEDEKYVAVLNNRSNTITLIDSTELGQQTLDTDALRQYRLEMLAAFRQVVKGAIDGLRGCFCDLLLPDCTPCVEDDQVTLARIEIHAGHVEHICNLSRRKFLKTWPTVEYWLSTVGLFGRVGEWVSGLCCPDEDSWGAEMIKDPLKGAGDRLKGFDLADGKAFRARQAGYAGRKKQKKQQKQSGGKSALDLGLAGFEQSAIDRIAPPGDPRDTVQPDVIVKQPARDAEEILKGRGVEVVEVLDYDPGAGAGASARFIAGAPTLRRGARVRLYQRDGRVVYYESAPSGGPAVALGETTEAIRELEGRRDRLLSAVASTTADLDRLSQAREAAEGKLKEATEALDEIERSRVEIETKVGKTSEALATMERDREAMVLQLEETQEAVSKLEEERVAAQARIEADRGELQNKMKREMAPFQPVTKLGSVDAQRARQLKAGGVMFVGQITELTQRELTAMLGNDAAAAREVLQEARGFAG